VCGWVHVCVLLQGEGDRSYANDYEDSFTGLTAFGDALQDSPPRQVRSHFPTAQICQSVAG
jgi:hypothetical protein